MAERPAFSSGAARLAEDTRARFLTEILARVPIDRVVEVHLFTPIRQGGVETGVAVVAARPESAPAPEVPNDPPLGDLTEAAADVVEPPSEPPVQPPVGHQAVDAVSVPGEWVDVVGIVVGTDDDAGGAPTAEPDIEPPPADLAAVLAGTENIPDADDDLDPPPAPRLTVFTARYRLTIKGPDRGKWDADVVAEADAPLVTVAAVVRGVQRRAGDAAEPDRLAADAVARLAGVKA